MTILVMFELSPQPKKQEEIRTFLRNILPKTREYTGNKAVLLSVPEENKDKLMLVEYWESRIDFIKYLNWRVKTGDFGELEAMLIQEPYMQFFEVLDDCYLT